MGNSKSNYCYNCAYPLQKKANYCSNCGQKNTDGRLSLQSFLGVILSTIFNLESKFFKTARHIFIPGKLTLEFFKGRHKRYFHPVRLFIVAALFLITIIGYQIKNLDVSSDAKIEKKAIENHYRNNFIASLDTLRCRTLEKFPANPQLAVAFDSLYKAVLKAEKPRRDSFSMNSFILVGGFDELNINVANEDFLNLSSKELVDKYEIKGFLNRLMFQQKAKLFKDKGTFFPFLLGNSLWVILLMMPFLALILKLLYIRHDYYYVEHLVFSFHTHTFAFLMIGLLILLVVTFKIYWIIAVAVCLLLIYLFISLRKVYQQGWFKTLLKLAFVNVVYVFLFFVFMIGGFLLGIVLF